MVNVKHLLFVYGTLRKGHPQNEFFSEDAEYVGRHITQPKYTMLMLGMYPGVVVGGNTPIIGELYYINQEIFEALDRYEAYPDLFDRIRIPTAHGEAWMYVYQGARTRSPTIPSGDWNSNICNLQGAR